jgi:hypothetical protein
MLSSWRANCDLQILIYETDPLNPNPEEITRVVDYIVGYVCKGNHTFEQQKDQLQSLINASQQGVTDKQDLIKLSRQLLNRCSDNRVISKQECMVLLHDLDLMYCTDKFEHINISGLALSKTINGKTKNIIQQYKKRQNNYHELSLHQFFHNQHKQQPGISKDNWVIPHYLGLSTKAIFPVNIYYAKATFIIHKPWIQYFDLSVRWEEEFNEFITKPTCPHHVKIAFARAINKHFTVSHEREPIATSPDLDTNMTNEQEDIIHLSHLHADPENAMINDEFNYGITHNWNLDSYLFEVSADPNPK